MSVTGPVAKATKFFFWKQVSVVGMSHHEFKGELHKIKQGAQLKLERDPGNQYDTNAIRVVDGVTNKMVGFIAKTSNGDVARFMDNGYEPLAYVQLCDGISLILNLWMEKANAS